MVQYSSVACPEPQAWSYVNGEALTDAHFDQLARFVYDYCGIRLTSKKKTMVDGRLRRRMRALGIANVNGYCRFLFDNDNPSAQAEMVHFIDAITTNKTDFFRESTHFDYLCREVLPEMAYAGKRQLSVWSAACSTGAEPYTLAMLLEEFTTRRCGIGYSVLASDISTDVLAKAVLGRYPMAMLEPVPPELRQRYVMVSKNAARPEFRIKPQLRSKVAFFQMNLMDAAYPLDRNFDVIFCRNVLIYFDRKTQELVLTRLCQHLRSGGYLFLGHSESVTGFDLPLVTVANTVFRRQ